MDPVKLSQLEFGKYDSWRILEDSYEGEEHLLLPAIRNEPTIRKVLIYKDGTLVV